MIIAAGYNVCPREIDSAVEKILREILRATEEAKSKNLGFEIYSNLKMRKGV